VHNNATVMAVLLLVIGVSVIGKEIGNLWMRDNSPKQLRGVS
jgi:hypothetical protein